ncbi:MAG TPA: SRPBCC family protein [Trichocoleus sp.]
MTFASGSGSSSATAVSLPSDSDWQKLKQREVLLTGEKGQYAVTALVCVRHEVAWSTLTDYNNFYRFLPTVAASRVVETDGSRSVVEQIDRRRVLMTTIESTVRTENLEIDERQISFRLIEGNLKYMYGHWRLDPVDWVPNLSDSLLISQWVRAEADFGPFKKLFYTLFEASLIETMAAIRDEMERRSAA